MIDAAPTWMMRRVRCSHPLSGGHKVFAMLQAYMDDSGTHDESAHCLVAGYWGGSREWKSFESEWKAVLASGGIREFKGNEFWPRPGGNRIKPYVGWNNQRHAAFIDRLLTVIQKHKIYPFGCGVVVSEFKKQPEHYRRVFAGYDHSHRVKEGALKSVYLPFQVAIFQAARYCHRGVRMNFVFDDDPRIVARASACFARLKDETREPDVDNLGELTFADSRIAVPIQAADLLAYELYHFGKQRDKGNAQMRMEAFRALARFRDMQDFWLFDERRFATFARNLEETRL